MAKQPETYGKLVNVYGFLLEPILYKLDVEEDGFQRLLDDWINLDKWLILFYYFLLLILIYCLD